ncbi:prevent-host-death family protein [Herbihabitans rhizosphaerae]|uniref:Antitoxin n=1 Tax=Herbihabitans rhizosphaerae TaxID=1872711 RepID=A0A4Q7KIJ5_9PSEU|nr:type II toxin-antitoxin system prevent-host-death family antitoxin [Herbihabitans rhizosphaerae]RZS34751.1 prevent-host-death family protein [Herbihabitans rhizosphaerae]
MTVDDNELPMRDVRARMADVVDAAEHRGEITVVTRNGRPAAAVVPLSLVAERRVNVDTTKAVIDDILAEDAGILDLLK